MTTLHFQKLKPEHFILKSIFERREEFHNHEILVNYNLQVNYKLMCRINRPGFRIDTTEFARTKKDCKEIKSAKERMETNELISSLVFL